MNQPCRNRDCLQDDISVNDTHRVEEDDDL